jgi:hypothetical protein
MAKQEARDGSRTCSFILIGMGIGGLVGVIGTTAITVSVCTYPDPDIPCEIGTLGFMLLLLTLLGIFACGSIGTLITLHLRSTSRPFDEPFDTDQENM